MDDRTGRIYDEETLESFGVLDKLLHPGPHHERNHLKPMRPTAAQLERKPPRVLPGDDCPCGSGKTFVDCCYTGPHKPCEKCGEVRFRTSYKEGGKRKRVACRNCGTEKQA